jgi:large subunit ribosomal protein L30
VSDKAQKTVRIKWVRSGIGFTYHQKRIVRSLGLKKLNQEVERPDTPQIRGLVAKVPHLVKIVEAASKPAWTAVPEYTIYAPEAVPSKLVETTPEQTEKIEAAPQTPAARTEKTEAAATGKVTGAPAASAAEPQPAEAPTAAEAATEVPGNLAATKRRVPADASAGEGAEPGGEAGSEEGQPKA